MMPLVTCQKCNKTDNLSSKIRCGNCDSRLARLCPKCDTRVPIEEAVCQQCSSNVDRLIKEEIDRVIQNWHVFEELIHKALIERHPPRQQLNQVIRQLWIRFAIFTMPFFAIALLLAWAFVASDLVMTRIIIACALAFVLPVMFYNVSKNWEVVQNAIAKVKNKFHKSRANVDKVQTALNEYRVDNSETSRIYKDWQKKGWVE